MEYAKEGKTRRFCLEGAHEGEMVVRVAIKESKEGDSQGVP